MAAKLRRTPKVSVASIAAAVESRDFVTALEGALVVWRATRQAQVADLVEAIAGRCQRVAIAGRSKLEFQDAWIVMAHNNPGAVAIGALAATLIKSLPVRDVSYLTQDRDLKRNRPFLERVEALGKLPEDPRIAAALVDLVVKAPFSDSRRLYEPVLALLDELADDRGLPVLERLIERPSAKGSSIRAYLAEALPETVAAIRANKRTPLAAGEAETIATLLGALGAKRTTPAPHRDVDELFAQVLAKPDDDALRLVLADALLAGEDPRGELITLQLRQQSDDPDNERKRAASLLRKHEKQWLGELATITKLRVWRRGFLDEAELQNHAVAEDATWQRLASDPQLATIRILHKGRANADLYRSFVLSPQMRALREVDVPSASLLKELIAAGRPLEHVVLEQGLTEPIIALLPELATTTGVTRLTFTVQQSPEALMDRLATQHFPATIDELVTQPRGASYQDWRYPEIWFAAHPRVRVRRLGVQLDTTRIVAEAGKRQPRLSIDAAHDWHLKWVLGQIGPFEHLAIYGEPSDKQLKPELAAALAKLPAGKVSLHGGWAKLVTDRGRARRARRS